VLPGLQLLDLMTRHMGEAHTLKVSQQMVSLGPQKAATPQDLAPQAQDQPSPRQEEEPPTKWQETLSYGGPGSLRVDSRCGDRHRISLLSGDTLLAIFDGRQVPEARWDRLNQYIALLCSRSREALQKELVQSGLDIMTSSIGRFQGTPCWILGAQYPDLTTPQIWIRKETFLPFRWVLPHVSDDGTLNLLEFRFLKWQKENKLWYPMQIQILEGDTLVREISVDRVEVNPTFDSTLFDIDYLKHLYPVSISPPPRAETPEGSKEIRQPLDHLKQRHE
jgi:hypothetical protein